MALVKTEKSVYDPSFDENTGKYIDVCPYKKHERNRTIYSCRCDVSVVITNRQQFCSHIKSKKHQELVNNFKQYSTPTEDVEKEVKQHRIEKGFLSRQNTALKEQNTTLKEKASKLMEELNVTREKNKKMIEEKEVDKKKRTSMRKTIKELNIQNKDKDEEIKKLKEQLQYLESQLIMEDDKYKEIIDFE